MSIIKYVIASGTWIRLRKEFDPPEALRAHQTTKELVFTERAGLSDKMYTFRHEGYLIFVKQDRVEHQANVPGWEVGVDAPKLIKPQARKVGRKSRQAPTMFDMTNVH